MQNSTTLLDEFWIAIDRIYWTSVVRRRLFPFGSEDPASVRVNREHAHMVAHADWLFGISHDALWVTLIVDISAVCDRAMVRGKNNLVLDTAWPLVLAQFPNGISGYLEQLKDQAQTEAKKVAAYRNRIIAHHDLQTAIGEPSGKEFCRETVAKAAALLVELRQTIDEILNGPDSRQGRDAKVHKTVKVQANSLFFAFELLKLARATEGQNWIERDPGTGHWITQAGLKPELVAGMFAKLREATPGAP